MTPRLAAACATALAAMAVLTSPVRAADLTCFEEQASTLPVPPAVNAVIDGRPTIRFVPPHPKGIVYLFHGSGGSEAFATRVHTQRVLSALIADGYGYAAAPSLDRTKVLRWDVSSIDPAVNPDVAYMLALHKDLIARGEISATTPVFTMGMSNGGAFAHLYGVAARAQGLPVVAIASYMGPWPGALKDAVPDPHKLPPTFLILSHNDGLVSTERTAQVEADLVKRGARIEMHVNPEHSVCPATLMLVPGLSPADRQTWIAKTLPAAGVIDAKGVRAVYLDKPVIDRDAMADLYKRMPEGRDGRLVADELIIAWAGHQMRSEYAAQQVKFFDQALAQR